MVYCHRRGRHKRALQQSDQEGTYGSSVSYQQRSETRGNFLSFLESKGYFSPEQVSTLRQVYALYQKILRSYGARGYSTRYMEGEKIWDYNSWDVSAEDDRKWQDILHVLKHHSPHILSYVQMSIELPVAAARRRLNLGSLNALKNFSKALSEPNIEESA